MLHFFVALFSIILSVTAQFTLKAGMSAPAVQAVMGGNVPLHKIALTVMTNFYVLGGFMLYGLGAVAWLGVLSQWDVSKAYPLVGLGFILTVAIGLFLGENVTAIRFLGVCLIAVGVAVVART